MNQTSTLEPVPMLDLGDEVRAMRGELETAIGAVLDGTRFILGPNVGELEDRFKERLGVAHAIGVNSGTDAIVIGLRALGIGPGDEVLVPSFTFFATAEGVSAVGATPVFVDIEAESMCIDAADAASKITDRTRGIIPVHLFGHAADMDAIMDLAAQHDLKVLEDVAQATGGTYQGRNGRQPLGSIGHAAAFSFFPSKNLGAYGDGGLLTTNDDEVARVANMLRFHGSAKKYHNELVGYNSRLDEMQAAILNVKEKRLNEANEGRRKVAARYAELLHDVPGIETPTEDGCHHVYHQYTVRIKNGRRDAVAAALKEANIASMIYYPVPVHRLPVYASGTDLPVTDAACDEVLSLPIWPTMSEAAQARVATCIQQSISTS